MQKDALALLPDALALSTDALALLSDVLALSADALALSADALQAVILILQMVEAKLIELVSSSVLEYENSRNPFIVNQQSAPSLRDATRTGKSKVKSQKSKIYQAHK